MRVKVGVVVLLALVAVAAAYQRFQEPKYNPYELLGVSSSASEKEIRKSFQQKALAWHPDKSDRPDAEKRFAELREAYDLLMDPARRRQYDLQRASGGRNYRQQSQAPESRSIGLNKQLFEVLVRNKAAGDLWVIQLYAPRTCRECQMFAGPWEEFVELTQGVLRTGRVDRSEDQDLAQMLGASRGNSYSKPWIAVLRSGKLLFSSPISGETSALRLVQVVAEKLFSGTKPPNLTTLKSYFEWTKSSSVVMLPRIVFVSKTRSSPHLVELYLSDYFEKRMAFAHVYVPEADKALLDALFADQEERVFPSVIVFLEPGTPSIILHGEDVSSSPEAMVHRLAKFEDGQLPKLTDENLFRICFEPTDQICLIAISSDILSVRQAMLPLSGKTDELVQIAWVDASEQREFVKFIDENFRDWKDRELGVVAVRYAYGELLPAPKEIIRSSSDLLAWINKVAAGSIKLKSSSKMGGIPFLEEASSFFGSFEGLPDIDWVSDIPWFMLISVVVLLCFINSSFSVHIG